MLGFSINLLTLFALVLAIGIVVDDAIVVVEAVHAKLERGAKNANRAAVETMKEIAPAIVSITLVMASVFVPVSFIGGATGVFYRQFGLTPLFFATGADSVGNRSIGISAIGGMLIGTVLGVLVIPSLYIVFQNLQEKFSKGKEE